MELYDEDKAIERMRAALPADVATTLDDDEFLNIIDMIMDWMEDNGLDDIDAGDDDLDADRPRLMAELLPYVTGLLRKDRGSKFPAEYAEAAINAELDYEDEIARL